MKALRLLPLLAILPFPSFAGTASANFQVTLNITGACTLAANPLDFGTKQGGITVNLDASSTLTPNCTSGQAYSIGLNNGVGSGATASVRKMTNSADNSTVDYTLYTNSGRTAVWDNNCTTVPNPGASTNCIGGTGTGSNQVVTVYGRVPATQTSVTVGQYVDTVVATLTF